MTIEILPQKFTICRVPALSANMLEEEFCFIGKTDRELSLVCWTDHVPENTTGREDGWRGIRIAGTLEFTLVGILSKISGILASEQIGIFAVSTYDTDYIFLKENNLSRGTEALRQHGYCVRNIIKAETGYNL